MLSLNEAPNRVLHALDYEKVENYARYLKYPLATVLIPLTLFCYQYSNIKYPPTRLTSEQKIYLQEFMNALDNLKVDKGGVQNKVEVIQHQVEKTLDLIDKASRYLPNEYNAILGNVRAKIVKKNNYESTREAAKKLFDVGEGLGEGEGRAHINFFTPYKPAAEPAVDNEAPKFARANLF